VQALLEVLPAKSKEMFVIASGGTLPYPRFPGCLPLTPSGIPSLDPLGLGSFLIGPIPGDLFP